MAGPVERAAARFLLVPAARRGGGTGHLRRCLRLARELGGEALLRLELPPGEDPEALLRGFGFDPREIRWAAAAGGEAAPEAVATVAREGAAFAEGPAPGGGSRPLVLLDRRASSAAELARYRALGLVVGLDEGGKARRFAPFLADSLPVLPGVGPANLSTPALLDLPPRGRQGRGAESRTGWGPRVLVSFGGEDPLDLSGRMLRLLLGGPGLPVGQITVTAGPRFGTRRWPAGARLWESPADLKERLHGFDLVFTQFGLTAFEALAAGVPVVCLSPTAYHRRLCRAAGLPEIGLRRPSARRLRSLLADPAAAEAVVERFQEALGRAAGTGGGVAGLLRALRPGGSERCPSCGREAPAAPAVARSPSRTYFSCPRCGLLFLLSFGGEEKRYGAAYFLEEYRAQYGRTYLEDFESIRRAGLGRLRQIEGLLARRESVGRESVRGGSGTAAPPRLVDVGCALGPFLQAARERGFDAAGIDVSPEAVEHVTGALGLPAACLDFQSEAPGDGGGILRPGSCDALTFWYVIEHFRDLARVLERARLLLKPGGVLALATPNARGVSGRKDLRAFLLGGPADHFTVWSPRSARRVLAAHGFRVERVRVTGHHPERFPRPWAPGGRDFPPDALRPKMLGAASRLLGLGDTFEIYARRGDGGER